MSNFAISGQANYEPAVAFAAYAMVDKLIRVLVESGVLTPEDVEGLFREAAEGVLDSSKQQDNETRKALEQAAQLLLDYVENSPDITAARPEPLNPRSLVDFVSTADQSE